MKTNWWNKSVIYQIFPDRFNIGDNKTIAEKIKMGLYPSNAVAKNWDSLPTNEEGFIFHFFGGDLQGIIEKIDYIKNLGVSVLYLTPIFSCGTYHGYDAQDYKAINKGLGDIQKFKELVNELHKENIKLIIDVSISHLSSEHPYFKEAITNPNSKYKDYFYFTNYPKEYQCWYGFDYLPQLNFGNPAVLEEFITNEDSVIKFWIKQGVDGIRFDCANDLGPKIDSIIYKTIKDTNPDAFMIGEIFNFAGDWANYLDGVQSYFFTSSIFSLFEGKISSTQFGAEISNAINKFPYEKLLNSPIFLSSHDIKRSLTKFNGNEDILFLATLLQFSLPGIPMIYYGEEIGMTGGEDPFNRSPMKWNDKEWNHSILEKYKYLIKLRNTRPELQYGKIIELSEWLNNGVIAYLRYIEDDPKSFSLVIINPTTENKNFRLFIPYSYFFNDLIMEDFFTGKQLKSTSSYMDVEIEPASGYLYCPDYLYKKNYSFFNRI